MKMNYKNHILPKYQVIFASDEPNCPGSGSRRVQQISKKFGCQTKNPFKSMKVTSVNLKMPIFWTTRQWVSKNSME